MSDEAPLNADEIEQFRHMAESWKDMPAWALDLFERAYTQLKSDISTPPPQNTINEVLALLDQPYSKLQMATCIASYIYRNTRADAVLDTQSDQERPAPGKLYGRLIRLAAALVTANGFLSPFADDHPATTPKWVLRIAESQREKLRLWAIEAREIANQLVTQPTPDTAPERAPSTAIAISVVDNYIAANKKNRDSATTEFQSRMWDHKLDTCYQIRDSLMYEIYPTAPADDYKRGLMRAAEIAKKAADDLQKDVDACVGWIGPKSEQAQALEIEAAIRAEAERSQ